MKMVKCIHDECCWPVCDKTCGLVPKDENYNADLSAEKGLIYHLQGRIAELKTELAGRCNVIDDIRITLNSTKKALVAIDTTRKTLNISSHWDDYERVCKFGYGDCIHDPGYLRKHYPDWWKELGMPISCEHCDKGEEYDDEDK
jgi:hypothetical protein